MYRFALLLLVAFVLAAPARAQEEPAAPMMTADGVEIVPAPAPRASPLSMARATLEDGTYIKIHYSAPHKRDRVIFGELVPFGAIWRTAANEGSEITFTQPVSVGGKTVPAGTYALFTIPGEAMWTVILNVGLGQSGTAAYSEALDVLRLDVAPAMMDKQYEAFTIALDEAEGGVDLALRWDRTEVVVPIRSH